MNAQGQYQTRSTLICLLILLVPIIKCCNVKKTSVSPTSNRLSQAPAVHLATYSFTGDAPESGPGPSRRVDHNGDHLVARHQHDRNSTTTELYSENESPILRQPRSVRDVHYTTTATSDNITRSSTHYSIYPKSHPSASLVTQQSASTSTTTTPNKQHNQLEAIEISEESQEMNHLRLEYYKYKIISHLGITGDPDSISPDPLKTKGLKQAVHDYQQNLKKAHAEEALTRTRRSLSCRELSGNKDACCLETFYVNFTDIGWDKWIIYPSGYDANYCRGQCDLSHARYYHSTLLSKFSSTIGLCCSPRQMAPLRLLYIDSDNKVHQKSMPDMIVDSCDCA